MKTLRIPVIDYFDLKSKPYMDLYIREKLKEVGFDLTKKIVNYEDLQTLDWVFEQKE